MKIRGPRFATHPALYGLRSVMVGGFPTEKWKDHLPELFRQVGPETLVILADSTRDLDSQSGPGGLFQFLKLAKLKGLRFAHFADQGFYPEWLQYLDHAIIEIEGPRMFKFGEDFNEAVKVFWFMRGKLTVQIKMIDPRDLEMAELLYSYTPNDLDFWIDISLLTDEDQEILMPKLLSRRFSTVRVNPSK